MISLITNLIDCRTLEETIVFIERNFYTNAFLIHYDDGTTEISLDHEFPDYLRALWEKKFK